MLKIFISIVLSLAFVMPAVAAEHLSGVQERLRDVREGVREEIRGEIREDREGVRGEIQDVRQDFREGAREFREGVRTEIKQLGQEDAERFRERRAEARAEMEKRREEFRAQVETKRAELRERVEGRRAELKERLQKIRDERKQQIVERIADRIAALSERLLGRFSDVLEKMEKVLDNISSRADKAEEHGRDVSAARAAIVDAHSAIAASRVAIDAQAGKEYDIPVRDEESLKVDVGGVRRALHDDLVAVRATVKTARDAVRNAAVTLAQIPRVDELEVETEEPEEEATSTAE